LSKPTCTVCNGTGDQRYWEGRWRDEAAENERLRDALKEIADDPTGISTYQADIAKAALANSVREP
jgi:hypothetical protein